VDEYNENLCVERHKSINDKMDIHDRRLNDHSGRIDKLEQRGASVDTKIENLCEQIKSLVSIMKWFLVTGAGALISFFFYAIQQNIFK